MQFLSSLPRRVFDPTLVVFTGAVLAGSVFLGGCGKAPEPTAKGEPQPAHSPASGKPSAVVQPPAHAIPPGKVVYVLTAFQAVNSDGTHDIPTGAAVKVLAEEGEEYVIEHNGISVKTPKAYFSETIVEQAVTPSPTPLAEAPSPTPDTIPLQDMPPAVTPNTLAEASPTPETAPAATSDLAATPEPAATPDPTMAADERKTTELINEIRTVNEEIRTASDKLELAPEDQKAKEEARIQKLKKRRDSLSEDLTKVSKP